MGQAKLRQAARARTAYHHTSTLRTNLIWMSGQINLEGQSTGVIHPNLGEITVDATLRRPMRQFPPLAWFTSRLDIPRCLIDFKLAVLNKDTGEQEQLSLTEAEAHALTLHRLALGFDIAGAGLRAWPDHPGYKTDEGRELNETALEVGDNPDDWYVSDTPVDVMKLSEIWVSRTKLSPKLELSPSYLVDVKKMVTLCRTTPGAYIPPSWLTPSQAREVGRRFGSPIREIR